MNEPFRLRYTNQIVGTFLLAILLFLIATSIVLMRAGDFFSTPVSYWIEVPQNEIGDLHRGAEVMMLGQRVGEVRTIDYIDDTDWVQIELAIVADKADQITENSEIQFERKFGVGAPILVIRRSIPDTDADRDSGNPSINPESIPVRDRPSGSSSVSSNSPIVSLQFPELRFPNRTPATLVGDRRGETPALLTKPAKNLAATGPVDADAKIPVMLHNSDPTATNQQNEPPDESTANRTLVQNNSGDGNRPPAGGRNDAPRRTLRFRGESDRLDKVAQEVAEVSDSVRLIQEQLRPTLEGIEDAADRFDASLDQTIDPAFRQADTAFRSLENTSETIRPETIQTLSTIQNSTLRLEQRITELTDRVEKLVDQDVSQTLAEIRQSSDRAAEASDSARQAADRAGLAADNVAGAADNINDTTDQVNRDIAKTLSSVRDAAVQVQRLAIETRQVVRIVRGEAEELPGTAERINATVADTQDLVGEIRGHWLLRNADRSDQVSRQVSPSAVRVGGVR